MDLYNWFWSPSVWIPPGYTWEDLAPREGHPYPNSSDLWVYPFIIAGSLLSLKYFILMPYVYAPIGKYFGVKNKHHKLPPVNLCLEKVYKKYKAEPPQDVMRSVTSEIGWNERQIQRWLRQRGASLQVTKLEKFCDCSWQLTYYILYCILGFVVHRDKSWLYDVRHCWYGFPEQFLDNDIWWYYMISLGFYWGQTFTHFFTPQRHDSVQMLCHHTVTITLTSLSFMVNMVRIGSLILLVHECADIPLLLAKIFGYCRRQKMMDIMFVFFVILWITTRLGVFPLRLLRSTIFEAHVQQQMFYPIYYIFNGMILSIFLMHLFWTYNIIQVIAKKFSAKNIVVDVRSSDDDLPSNDDEVYPQIKDTKKEK
uniref:Ceramide synthase 6-like n=1 Tax=Hirondellea gigas TaxID=1518452 RepID=A0A2P2I2I8_9CRUS